MRDSSKEEGEVSWAVLIRECTRSWVREESIESPEQYV